MAKKVLAMTPLNMIRFSLGLFFIILGVLGIVRTVEESVFTLNNHYPTLEIVFGIVELICGLFLILGKITPLTRAVKQKVSVIIFFFWAARVILSKIVWGIVIGNSGFYFKPSLSTWLLVLSCELIIASCLWLNMQTYSE